MILESTPKIDSRYDMKQETVILVKDCCQLENVTILLVLVRLLFPNVGIYAVCCIISIKRNI